MRIPFALACVLVVATIPAQRGRAFVSIEAHVGTAHSVHVGTVVSLEPVEHEKPKEGFFPGTPHRVTFAVKETIKGTRARTLDLLLTLQHTFNLEYLRDHKIEVMLCATKDPVDEEAELGLDGSRYSFRILAPIRHPKDSPKTKWIADQLNIGLNEGRMLGLNLEVVRQRNEILRRARVFARAHRGILGFHFLLVPNEFGVRCGYTNAYCGITLPLCKETKALAGSLLKNPRRLFKDVRNPNLEWRTKSVMESLEQLLARFEPEG